MGADFMIVAGPYRRVSFDLQRDFALWVLEDDAALVDSLVYDIRKIVTRTNEVMSADMGMPELEKLHVVKASVPVKSVGGKGPVGLVLVKWGRETAFQQDMFLRTITHELLHHWFPGPADLDMATTSKSALCAFSPSAGV